MWKICTPYLIIHRIFDSPEGPNAIKAIDDLTVLIKQKEIDILSKWSVEVTERIHASTSKYLLFRTEKGLISMNFDENVSTILNWQKNYNLRDGKSFKYNEKSVPMRCEMYFKFQSPTLACSCVWINIQSDLKTIFIWSKVCHCQFNGFLFLFEKTAYRAITQYKTANAVNLKWILSFDNSSIA